MPRKKLPADPDAGAWRVILEDMHGQMKVFGDALNAGLRDFGRKLDDFRGETSRRFDVLEVAVRQNSVDIRDLATRVEKLERIEERVTVLEQRRR